MLSLLDYDFLSQREVGFFSKLGAKNRFIEHNLEHNCLTVSNSSLDIVVLEQQCSKVNETLIEQTHRDLL